MSAEDTPLAARQALMAAQRALDEGREPDEALPGLDEQLADLDPATRAAVGEEIAGLAQVDAWLRAWPEPRAPEGELDAIADVVLQKLDDELPHIEGEMDVTEAPVFDDDDAEPPAEASGPEALISGAYSLDALTAHVAPPSVQAAETTGPAAVVSLGARRAEQASAPPMKIWLAAAAAVGLGFVGFAMFGLNESPDEVAMSAPAGEAAATRAQALPGAPADDMADLEAAEESPAEPTSAAAALPAEMPEPETEIEAEAEGDMALAEARFAAEAQSVRTETETATGAAPAPPMMARRRRARSGASLDDALGGVGGQPVMRSRMAAAMSTPQTTARGAGGGAEAGMRSDADAVRAAARRTRTAVRACLPADTGALVVRVEVEGPTGRVRRVVSTRPSLTPDVRACIERAMRGAHFPERTSARFQLDVRY